jgi:pimeloyl-ACP methyl ester carboxylesterase
MPTVPLEASYAVGDEPGWKDLPWEEHLRSATVAGTRVQYVDAGSGPGIVLLHGIAGCWQNWIQNIPRLALEHRVIALDFPGFGGSPLPRARISVALYARVVDELCEQLGVGRVTLAGNSLGGLVTMEVAARYPERVQRAVLVAPAGVSIGRPDHGLKIGLQLAAVQSRQAIRLVRRLRGGSGEHPIALIVAHPERFERGLLKTALIAGAGSPAFGLIAVNLTELWLRRRLLEAPPAMRCPTLLVWGRGDRIVPLADAAVLAEMIAGSRTKIIEDAGHVPMLERAAEFNRMLLDFAQAPDGAYFEAA